MQMIISTVLMTPVGGVVMVVGKGRGGRLQGATWKRGLSQSRLARKLNVAELAELLCCGCKALSFLCPLQAALLVAMSTLPPEFTLQVPSATPGQAYDTKTVKNWWVVGVTAWATGVLFSSAAQHITAKQHVPVHYCGYWPVGWSAHWSADRVLHLQPLPASAGECAAGHPPKFSQNEVHLQSTGAYGACIVKAGDACPPFH
eukprot:1155134-Pelagomonas_calceolata.AAC.3